MSLTGDPGIGTRREHSCAPISFNDLHAVFVAAISQCQFSPPIRASLGSENDVAKKRHEEDV
jgi:hypothetical protein